MKDVLVAVRSGPLTTTRVHEALRMALGMTLSNHRVTVAYVGDGATAALALKGELLKRPGLAESIDLFEACRIQEVVDRETLPPTQRTAMRSQVRPIERNEVVALFAKADVVIPW